MKTQSRPGPKLSDTATLRRAEIALTMGRPAEAMEITNSILETDDTHVGALELMAKAQWQLESHKPLLETLSRLIRINPYEPGYHCLRGAAFRALGRYRDSLRSFIRAGAAPGAEDAAAELCAMQSELVLQLLSEDPVFRAHYAQNPELACSARGFEFGSASKARNWVLTHDYSGTRLHTRPS